MEKRVNSDDQHFLIFQQYFHLSREQAHHFILYQIITTFDASKEKRLFPQCFLPFQREIAQLEHRDIVVYKYFRFGQN